MAFDQMLADALSEIDQLRADIARLAAERDEALSNLTEAEATIVRAQQALGVDHPVWTLLDDYDGSMDSVKALVAERDEARRQERQAAYELGLMVDERDAALAEVGRYEHEHRDAATTYVRLKRERDEARAMRDSLMWSRDVLRTAAEADRDAMRPVVEAAARWAEVEAGRTPTMENCSGWLTELAARRDALLAAVDQMGALAP